MLDLYRGDAGSRGLWKGDMNTPGKSFHGWYIVASCFVISLLVGGIAGSVPWQWISTMDSVDEMQGFGRGMMAVMPPLFFMSLIVGWLVDRFGCKKPMLVGCLLSGAGVILFAGISQVWHYALLSLIVVTGGLAAMGIPMDALLLRWFRRNRGLAIALATMGASIGRESMMPAVSFMRSLDQANDDWRKPAVLIIGITVLIITIPLIRRFIKDRPAEMGLWPDGIETGEEEPVDFRGDTLHEAYRMPTFWYIAGALFFANILSAVPSTYLMAVGYHKTTLIGTGQFLAGFAFLCMPFIGVLADRKGAGWTFVAIACVFATCVGILVVMPVGWSAVMLIPLQKICAIGVGILAPIIIAERFGLYRFGIIFAVLLLIGGLGSMAGGVIIGLPVNFLIDRGFDSTMTFRVVLAVQIIFLLLSAFLIRRATLPSNTEPTVIESDQA